MKFIEIEDGDLININAINYIHEDSEELFNKKLMDMVTVWSIDIIDNLGEDSSIGLYDTQEHADMAFAALKQFITNGMDNIFKMPTFESEEE